jgi:hypothetical protein
MTYEIDAKRNVTQHYGVRTTDSSKGAQSKGTGNVKRAQWDWSWDNLPVAGATNLEYAIPAGASIISATLIADSAWNAVMDVGTTGSLVGFFNDVDLATDGEVNVSAGALVGAKLATALELVVSSAATTGTARLIVEFVYDK